MSDVHDPFRLGIHGPGPAFPAHARVFLELELRDRLPAFRAGFPSVGFLFLHGIFL